MAKVKLAGISAVKFYVYVGVTVMPFVLVMNWPEETPFSFHLLFKFLYYFLVNPLHFAAMGMFFVLFFFLAVIGENKNAV
jgi:hypothetical protein